MAPLTLLYAGPVAHLLAFTRQTPTREAAETAATRQDLLDRLEYANRQNGALRAQLHQARRPQ